MWKQRRDPRRIQTRRQSCSRNRRFNRTGTDDCNRSRGSRRECGLSRQHARARRNVRSCRSQAFPVTGDLTDRETPRNLVEATIAHFGQVDILINNAGTIHRSQAIVYPEKDWAEVIEVNLNSVFRLSQLAGRHMIERGRGKILNIASLLSFQGGVTVPAYAAAKGGVAQLTKALANEWAGKGVNVNAIAPGYMRTENTRALQEDETRNRQILERIPAGRWGEPSDLAGAAVFLCSAASDYVNGHVLVVDGGWMGR